MDNSTVAMTGGQPVEGTMLGLDEKGGLLVKTADGARVITLCEAAVENAGAHG